MKLKELAENKLTLTFGHINPTGMTKLDTADIENKELTVVDFDFATDKESDEVFGVAIFKEHANCFYFCGLILTDLFIAIQEDKEALAEFKKDGLKIKLKKEATQNGKKTVTKVVLL